MSALMKIRPYAVADEDAVVELWRACGLLRWSDPRKDIARKLKVNPELFLVGETDGRVMATCMIGYEGHRGWINLKAAITSKEEHSILAECERGEDSAVSEYQKALDTDGLPQNVAEVIHSQYEEVKAAHDHICGLRDSLVAK